MKAMVLNRLCNLQETDTPLELADLPAPAPGRAELLVKVSACGVCHTELDEIEGRTPPPRLPVILGHQVVGRVVELGERHVALALVAASPGSTQLAGSATFAWRGTRICALISGPRAGTWTADTPSI